MTQTAEKHDTARAKQIAEVEASPGFTGSHRADGNWIPG